MTKKTSTIISYTLLSILVLCLILAGISRNRNVPTHGTLKFAHNLPTSHPVHKSIVYMGKRLKEISGGKMKLIIFPSGQMGDETRCIEQVQRGSLAMVKTSTAPMGNFVSLMKVFSLPYLFDNSDHFWRVLDGEIGNELLQRLSMLDNGKASGFKGLGFFDAGSRNFYATYSIQSPDDLKGKKFRVMRDPVAMDLVASLGGSPTPIPWGELYTALKQGVVDGAENNPPSIISSRHSEVCKFLILDAHSRIPDMVVISTKIWNGLSSQEQAWLTQAMHEATEYQKILWHKSTQDALDKMRADGVSIREVDTAPFRAAVKPVIKKYATGEIKKIYDRIRAVH